MNDKSYLATGIGFGCLNKPVNLQSECGSFLPPPNGIKINNRDVPVKTPANKPWIREEEHNGRVYTIEKTRTNGKEIIGSGWHFYIIKTRYGLSWAKAVKRIKDSEPDDKVQEYINKIKIELAIRARKYER